MRSVLASVLQHASSLCRRFLTSSLLKLRLRAGRPSLRQATASVRQCRPERKPANQVGRCSHCPHCSHACSLPYQEGAALLVLTARAHTWQRVHLFSPQPPRQPRSPPATPPPPQALRARAGARGRRVVLPEWASSGVLARVRLLRALDPGGGPARCRGGPPRPACARVRPRQRHPACVHI